jgi:hypothetical protein
VAWTSPATWTPGQVVGATDLNTHLRDNMTYVGTQRPNGTIKRTAGNYTTTSLTFVDVDVTNVIVTFSTVTGKVLVGCSGRFASGINNQGGYVALMVDGALYGVGGTFGQAFAPNLTSGSTLPINFCFEIAGLSLASHTFKLQWRVDNAGAAGTLFAVAADPLTFFATEIG